MSFLSRGHVKTNVKKHSLKFQGRTYPILVSIGMLFIFLGSAASTPIGSSADDSYHLPSIWCSWPMSSEYCEKTAEKGTYLVPSRIDGAQSLCYLAIDGHMARQVESAKCIEGISKSEKSLSSHLNQNIGYYPPLFYQISRVFVMDNVEKTIFSIRMFWSLIFIFLFVVYMRLTHRTNHSNQILRFLVAMVPLGVALVPSTNPSSAAVISLFFYPAFLSLAIQNTGTFRRGITLYFLTFCTFILGALSRTDAFFYLVFASVAVFFIYPRRWKSKGVLLTLPAAVISAFILRNARQSDSLLSGLGGNSQLNWNGIDLLSSNLSRFLDFVLGFWGYHWGLGWKFEPPLPGHYAVLLFAIFTVTSIRKLRIEKGEIFIGDLQRRLIVVILGLTLLMTIAIYQHQVACVGIGDIVQPRYLYPMFVSITFFTFNFDRSTDSESEKGYFDVIAAVTISLIGTLVVARTFVRFVNGGGSGDLVFKPESSWFWVDSSFLPLFLSFLVALGYVFLVLSLILIRQSTTRISTPKRRIKS